MCKKYVYSQSSEVQAPWHYIIINEFSIIHYKRSHNSILKWNIELAISAIRYCDIELLHLLQYARQQFDSQIAWKIVVSTTDISWAIECRAT